MRIAIAALSLLAVTACGGGITQETLTAATTRAADAEKAAAAAQDATAVAERKLATAQTAATEAAAKAKKAAESALTARTNAVASKESALVEREKKVGLAETEAKNNEVPGSGIYLVGSDIKPGTYKAAPSTSGNCYYARLTGPGGDIIDNGNQSGPVVITVKATDGALELSGCETLRKVG